jgi:flagellar hook-associated protein FlgK
MRAFDIGLSAMNASQRALDLAGQNIANANTPGYHRQTALLTPRVLGGEIGQGVDVQMIRRVTNQMVERSITVNRFQTGRVNSELDTLRQIETLMAPGPGSIGDQTEKLFNQLEQLATRPDDTPQRRVVLSSATALADQFNNVGRELGQMRDSLRVRIDETVGTVNDYAEQLADYNDQIRIIELSGREANELRDKRDTLLNELAGLIDVRVIEQPYGVVNVLAPNAPLVVGASSTAIQANTDPTGAVFISAVGSTTPLPLTGGALTGQVNSHNDILTVHEPRLNDLARQLAASLDGVQATGLGLTGPQTSALGARPVASATAPLGSPAAGTALPIQAGSLWVSVTDQTSGQRTLHEVQVDPATQSLQDLAGAITAATSGQVQGSVASGNVLQLQAQAGYSFDFAGRVPSSPENVVMGGTAVPVVTGVYTGGTNGIYSFAIAGTGTVGTTPNLELQIRDVNNNLVGSVNIGQGYTPGTPISVGNGLTVRIGAGTTSNGTFNVPVLAQPDTSGALAALGVNTMFTGNDAVSLRVRPELAGNPALLAASRDGNVGDASNLRRMVSLRDQPLMSSGTETFQQNVASMVGDIGAGVRARDDQQTALASLGQGLLVQQQAASGVDPNEEALSMVQFQREFQMAAKYITTVNTMLDDLLNIIR